MGHLTPVYRYLQRTETQYDTLAKTSHARNHISISPTAVPPPKAPLAQPQCASVVPAPAGGSNQSRSRHRG